MPQTRAKPTQPAVSAANSACAPAAAAQGARRVTAGRRAGAVLVAVISSLLAYPGLAYASDSDARGQAKASKSGGSRTQQSSASRCKPEMAIVGIVYTPKRPRQSLVAISTTGGDPRILRVGSWVRGLAIAAVHPYAVSFIDREGNACWLPLDGSGRKHKVSKRKKRNKRKKRRRNRRKRRRGKR